MSCNKLNKKAWFKVITLLLINTFLFTNLGWAAAELTVENSYLAPFINIDKGTIFAFFTNSARQNGPQSLNLVSHVKPKATGKDTRFHYLTELNRLKGEGYIQSLDHADRAQLRFSLTGERKEAYLKAIKEELEKRGEQEISPDLLFEAAKNATINDKSSFNVPIRIGLQPGTFNPLHYGHLSASLAGILGLVIEEEKDQQVKVMTLLANGGTVPDKPYAASADIRNEMARLACEDPGLNEWVEVTAIRAEIVDMFNETSEALKMAGANEVVRRFNMDMAAFIWLFVANPDVKWIYQVGSDKVAAYGKKNERGLLEKTLSRPEAHATIVYFPREGEKINVDTQIRPFPWLSELWDKYFFHKTSVSSFTDLSATGIRSALVAGENEIDGRPLTDTMPLKVADYITDKRSPEGKTLRYLYRVENMDKAAAELIEAGSIQEGMDLYAEALGDVKREYDKTEDKRAVSENILDNVYLLLLANEIRALKQEVKDDAGNVEKENLLKDIAQIFLLYSAAPGTGKKELMEATFKEGVGKFSDIIDRLTLYHTRKPRKSEKDGSDYHFRGERELRALARRHPKELVLTQVNRQLQGMAMEDFVEEGILLKKVTNASKFKSGDVIVKIKKDEKGNIEEITVNRRGQKRVFTNISIAKDSIYDLYAGDVITKTVNSELKVNRRIQGLNSVFPAGQPVILEGGYGWFREITKQYPRIVTQFILPFRYGHINGRGKNTAWINEHFDNTIDRLVAHRTLRKLIARKEGEINLHSKTKQVRYYRQLIIKAVEDERAAKFNAELIESKAFIQDLNDLLKLFKKNTVEKDEYNKVRALAYEVNRRIVFREGELRFSRGKRPAFGEGETDLQFDRYNRMLEGIVQILHSDDYWQNRSFGKIVNNAWGYTEKAKKKIIKDLTENFTRFFFESIIKGIRQHIVERGHPKTAPPLVEDILRQIENLGDLEISNMLIADLASMIENLVDNKGLELIPDLQQIFLIYSAAPGTGKGELMDATFEKNKGKYRNIIGKLILYHTRNNRVEKGKSEKDGVKYHFRTEKELRRLEEKGYIITAWVNRQLQGLATNDFVEEGVLVSVVKKANKFRKGDVVLNVKRDKKGNIEFVTVKRNGIEVKLTKIAIDLDSMYELLEGDEIEKVSDDELTVKRQIKGMSAVFSSGRPVVLEGGFDWFNVLSSKYPEIVSMFLAPFTDLEVQIREKNTEWINTNFNEPQDRLIAYRQIQVLVKENEGEINLEQADEKGKYWRQSLRQTVEKQRIVLANAELIESQAFINGINELLRFFKEPALRTKNQYDRARALAYEIDRRLSFREGARRFSRGKRPEFDEREIDMQHDRYNRVLEGVVQILKRNRYIKRAEFSEFGNIIENPWGYTKIQKTEVLRKLVNNFTRFYFEAIIIQVKKKITNSILPNPPITPKNDPGNPGNNRVPVLRFINRSI